MRNTLTLNAGRLEITPIYDAVAFIGRFQILHDGHMAVIEQAFNHGRKVIIFVGSSNAPRSYRNPFTFEDRHQMILDAIGERNLVWLNRLVIVPVRDMAYNDEQWIKHVHSAVTEQVGEDAKVALIGHSKDSSSFYLQMFPQWNSIPVKNYQSISATPIRAHFFDENGKRWINDWCQHFIPNAVRRFLKTFTETAEYQYLVDEYRYIQDYRSKFAMLEYPPIFVTVDACVIQSGHILLVKRKSQPGKNLWAMPGGFIRADETIENGMIRELREETKIKVPEPVLRGSIVTTRVFDDPYRSARGRTITHASLIHLKRDAKLPAIKGSDDAEKAKWYPLAKVQSENLFEDHFSIITALSALT